MKRYFETKSCSLHKRPLAYILAMLTFHLWSAQATAHTNVRPLFGVPASSKKSDPSLKNELIRMVNKAPPKARIRATFYMASLTDFAEALLQAHKRGVHVQILLDNAWKKTPGGSEFKHKLESKLGKNLISCSHGGCMAWKGNNHNKFMTISETVDPKGKKIKNVSIQLSSNMTSGQLKKYQDMLVIENDPDIYGHYFQYWQDLAQQKENYNYMNQPNGTTRSRFANITVFSSSSKTGYDPVLHELKKVAHCRPSRDRVDLAHSLASFDFAQLYIKELKRIKKLGCDIHIILNDSTDPKLIRLIRDYKLRLTLLQPGKDSRFHSKILLIHAQFRSGNKLETRKLVFAGSRNLGLNSLVRNDDTTIRVRGVKTYTSYVKYLNKVHALAKLPK